MGNSEFSKNSLKVSLSIAQKLQARLSLFHVRDTSKIKDVMMSYRTMGAVSLDVPAMGPAEGELHLIQAELDKEKMTVDKYYEEIKPLLTVSHSFNEVEGDVAEEILKASRTVDLISMARVIKSNGDCLEVQPAIMHVVKNTNKPLLAICEDKEIGDHALVAYDGSRSANNCLRAIGDLSAFFKKITVLTVKKIKEDALPILEEASHYLQSYGLSVETVHLAGNPLDQIVNTAKELNVSLIFIGGYGDNKLKEMLVGSVTEKVLTHTTIPVLLSNG